MTEQAQCCMQQADRLQGDPAGRQTDKAGFSSLVVASVAAAITMVVCQGSVANNPQSCSLIAVYPFVVRDDSLLLCSCCC